MDESTESSNAGSAWWEEGQKSLSDLAQSFSRFTLRPIAGVGEVELVNGHCLQLPIRSGEEDSAIESMSYYFASHTVEVITRIGHVIDVELDRVDGAEALNGRPVIYLDQCHWSSLANRLNGAAVPPAVIPAVDRIIELARGKEIVLPMSAGHFVETTAAGGAKRTNLASTILTLSRGWRMRHPIQVRQDEARHLISGIAAEETWMPPPVFTLNVASMFNESITREEAAGFPPEIARLLDQLTSVMADYDTLMEPDRIGSERITVWEDTYTRVMNDPEFRALSTPRRKDASRGLALVDISEELARICLDHSIPANGIEGAAKHLFAGVPSMPFWGLYTDALDFRLSQGNTKWQSNDLIDMLYLSCAAGYAEIVVAERAANNYLNSVWKGRGEVCPVVRTMAEAVERL